MIAVDAMGGDYAPDVVVHGAVAAARKNIPVILFGNQQQLLILLNQVEPSWNTLPIQIVHCSQEITMAEEPTKAVLEKKDASLVAAVRAVERGTAHAVVSAGNTGACLAAGTLFIGRAPGVLRPALGNMVPTQSKSVFCLDLGANTDCKPEFLAQFAQMGHVYLSTFHNITHPRIGLLSNGAEPYKGSRAIKEAYSLLAASGLNFVGNVEPRQMMEGAADVLVCDGLVGNVLLKTMEATAGLIQHWLKESITASWLDSILFSLRSAVFKRVKERANYERFGGALLLGIKKPLIVAHGCSNAHAIEQAIIFAHRVVQEKMIDRFNAALTPYLAAPVSEMPVQQPVQEDQL